MTPDDPGSKVVPDLFSSVKYVFLDRDGVINRKAPDGAYVTSLQDFVLLPDVERAIALLNQASRKVIVVTNQRGIALKLYSQPELALLHQYLSVHLNSFGAHIDAIYVCPHDYGQCNCRKPATGLFDQAFRDFPEATPDNSVMIGDTESDMLAGARMGMRTILITDKVSTGSGMGASPSAAGRSLIEVVETYLASKLTLLSASAKSS